MNHATSSNHSFFNPSAGQHLLAESAHAVLELNGFKKGDRIAVTDVDARPPQAYSGEISTVFSDGFAHVVFDQALPPAAQQTLKHNGRVNLHWSVHQ